MTKVPLSLKKRWKFYQTATQFSSQMRGVAGAERVEKRLTPPRAEEKGKRISLELKSLNFFVNLRRISVSAVPAKKDGKTIPKICKHHIIKKDRNIYVHIG
ncbi:hypothetical protein CRENBAI_026610 [Crenichthys baileyi]|uniref:Uncharacterized protein n=1 Tax=Crenichthys baileyi TaxID=28760 RepID=A0AAV9RHH2_9TELE